MKTRNRRGKGLIPAQEGTKRQAAGIAFRFLPPSCLFAAILCSALSFQPSALADDSVCARVRIEILQELTLERQAFEAEMTINNGLAGVPLTDISVDVTFADKNNQTVRASWNPNDLTALFFIRFQAGSSLPASISGGASWTTKWLMIPSKGAGGVNPQGELYYVGATLRYRAGGETNVVEVSPDSIRVQPMPDLTLDYFLPGEVYGDDPFTTYVEPPVPFSLGVRVLNTGSGPAHTLRIDYAQPRIVANELGLLADFHIRGCEVNGQPATASLLANFGDIASTRAGVARWIMTSTLSGWFTNFTASVSHSDELGGELTSLIASNNVHTHYLVHDVLVDLPGRDAVRDFLAREEAVLRVYESDTLDSVVPDVSQATYLSASGRGYTLSVPPSAGLLYIRQADPQVGTKTLKLVRRADGKAMNPANAWLSATQDRVTHGWHYFVNVFDVNNTSGLAYTIEYDSPPSPTNRPPRLDSLSDWKLAAGNYLSFVVTSADPDDDVLTYSFDSPPPNGATLHPAIGQFSWRPTSAQAPTTNVIRIRVTDNGNPALSDTRSFTVVVKSNTPPTLTAVPDMIADVLVPVVFTNYASAGEGDLNLLTFSLASGAPDGATINPTSGVFRWTPSRAQAASTNVITVKVSNSGIPPMSASRTFTAIVRDYLEVTVGGLVIAGGETNSVPIVFASSAALTNLSFLLQYPGGRLTNVTVHPTAASVGAVEVQSTDTNEAQLRFTSAPGQYFGQPEELAQLSFTALDGQHSGFFPIGPMDALGLRYDGEAVPRNLLNRGEIIYIGIESLLRAFRSPDNRCYLVVYGHPGASYALEQATELGSSNQWSYSTTVKLTNNTLLLQAPSATNGNLFYRARQ